MSHSTHVGFRLPVIYTPPRFALAALLLPPAFDAPNARAVGHIARALTASINVPPSLDFRGVTRPPFVPSELVGVGHIARQPLCFCIDGAS